MEPEVLSLTDLCKCGCQRYDHTTYFGDPICFGCTKEGHQRPCRTGFVFDNLEYLDFALQRPSGLTQGMLGSLGISSDAQVAKFKLAVERLKPAHTQVTFN